MRKKATAFEIAFPLSRKQVVNGRIKTVSQGELIVTGTAYCDPTVLKSEVDDRYGIDIDFIRFNGTDIKPVLEATGTYEEVENYCFERVPAFFTEENVAA